MKTSHRIETLLARGMLAAMGALPWRGSLAAGACLGDLTRALGIRRRVARENLARAFPLKSAAEREQILVGHYRELGRVAVEYARLDRLVRAAAGEVVASATGIEHLEAARGRGAILLSGHFSNFEVVGAWLGRLNPLDFVVRPLSNPGVEAWIAARRRAAGVGLISADDGLRGIFQSLRAGRWVAFLADQDARAAGVFVPFFGHPASTPVGPARIALKLGVPILMGFVLRRDDGRFDLEVDPPLPVPDGRDPDAARTLTALHTARLEERVRRRPELWFWLHRRWKTAPPATDE